MTWMDAKGTFKQWGLRFAIVTGVSLIAFIAKTEDSRLNNKISVLESDAVSAKVTLGRLEEKIDSMRAQLDRIERKDSNYVGQDKGSAFVPVEPSSR